MSHKNTMEMVSEITVAALNATKSNTFSVCESTAMEVASFIEIVYKKCDDLQSASGKDK